MNGLMKLAGGLAVGAALHASLLPMAAQAADDKDVIDYRQHIMNTMSEQASALGQVLSTAVPPENLVAHLEVIALAARMSLKSFEPKVLGGESKPEVWEKWADFSERMNTFAASTAKVAQLAKEKGQDAIMADLVDALSCKSCHDIYRDEKKK